LARARAPDPEGRTPLSLPRPQAPRRPRLPGGDPLRAAPRPPLAGAAAARGAALGPDLLAAPGRVGAGRGLGGAAGAPAAAGGRAARGRAAPARAVGRPRLRDRGAARAAAGALDRAADLEEASPRPAAAAAGADDLARPPPAGEDARPARTRALAGRAHERLATQLAPDLDSLGAAGRALPSPAPARLLDDHLPGARLVIVRPVPVPGDCPYDR